MQGGQEQKVGGKQVESRWKAVLREWLSVEAYAHGATTIKTLIYCAGS